MIGARFMNGAVTDAVAPEVVRRSSRYVARSLPAMPALRSRRSSSGVKPVVYHRNASPWNAWESPSKSGISASVVSKTASSRPAVIGLASASVVAIPAADLAWATAAAGSPAARAPW